MKRDSNTNLTDRLEAAAKAKQAMLEKFRTRPAADDPAVIARQEARQAISDARAARVAEREAAHAAQAAQVAEREAAIAAQAAREAAEATEREAALEVERKAARDARYAARKARK